MSSSQSSDSEPEPDLDSDWGRVAGENPGAGQDQTPEDLIKLIEETNPAKISRITVEGEGNTIYTGPTINLIREKKKKKNEFTEPPPSENTEETKRLERIVDGIRDYYTTNLMVLSPLPWVHLRSSSSDVNHVELVIKQISSGGRVDR